MIWFRLHDKINWLMVIMMMMAESNEEYEYEE